jgi:hypothetical protein
VVLSCSDTKSVRGIVACLTIALLLGAAFGQDNFVPISPADVSQYHINFERLFFVSLEAEKRERAQLYASLKLLGDLQDEASLADASQLNAEVTTRTTFLRQELMQISDRQLGTLVAHRPSLKLYMFAIDQTRFR